MTCVNKGHGSKICRVGQNHIYTVYIRYFWQENHQIYGHIRCIHTVLANPKNKVTTPLRDEVKWKIKYSGAMK